MAPTRTPVARTVAATCACLAVTMWASSAGQELASERTVIVRLASTSRTGATGSSYAQSRESMPVGGSKESYLYARVVAGQSVSIGGAEKPEFWPRPFTHSWRVLVQVASIDGDKTTLDVSWTRVEAANPAAPPHVTDRRTITLKLGQRHVLDFVTVDDPGSETANVVLEVATPLDDSMDVDNLMRRARANAPVTGAATLTYDLWLVHESAGGGRITRHVQVTGQEGLMVPFQFQRLAFPLEASLAGQDLDGPVRILHDGRIRGQANPDGSIVVFLLSNRTTTCSSGVSANESGMKQVLARPDETTAVDFPWVMRACPLDRDVTMPANPRPGVTVRNGRLLVDFKDFFAGERTSILVRARVREP